jgi:hypothetical protein
MGGFANFFLQDCSSSHPQDVSPLRLDSVNAKNPKLSRPKYVTFKYKFKYLKCFYPLRETNQLLCADQSEATIDVIQDIIWSLKHQDCLKEIPKLIFFDTVRDRTYKYGFPLPLNKAPGKKSSK